MVSALEKTIVALDQMSIEEVEFFLGRPENSLPFVKIGLELYLKYGPDLILKIYHDYKKHIFLDLKLHDIPKTVERAIHSLKGLPIEFLTVHIGGGEAMLRASMTEAQKSLPECKILGVSFLTSLEEKDLLDLYGINDSQKAFYNLFNKASVTGLDGVICSPHEIKMVKKYFPKLMAITPGIRFNDEINGNELQDQKRVASPEIALNAGADFLVIGRSLTKASDLKNRLDDLKKITI